MFSKYSEQQIKAVVAALRDYKEKPYVSYEWEELVYRLSNDNDPQLRKMAEILDKELGHKIFRK